MPRLSFGLKDVFISIAALGLLISQGPPYFRGSCMTCRSVLNSDFWNVAGLEAFVLLAVLLTRAADKARHDVGHAPSEEADVGSVDQCPPSQRREEGTLP